VEARQSDRHADLGAQIVRFNELRDDWYRGADLMARLIARAASGTPIIFVGFPRQWGPLFAAFGVTFQELSAPQHYVPIASDLSYRTLARTVSGAGKKGRLRQLAEVFAATDPVLADVLHKLDRRVGPDRPDLNAPVPLTGWQSYGRAEVQRLAREISELPCSGRRRAVALPCSRMRPYNRSKTHRRLWRELTSAKIERDTVDILVISSIGVVPEAFWNHPVVLRYDSGVPDIYRVLRLMRSFFSTHRYDLVVDCLEFQPYSDCLGIATREGLIGVVENGVKRRVRRLPCP
jgi:predicted RNA-binding protein